MARGRRTGKRTNKTVRLSIPKRLYYILQGIAGNNEQKLNRLIRIIIEEKLESSTVAEIASMLESKNRAKEEEEQATEQE
ncbi:hypothetical protein C7457_1741 [Thermovibrio guaymasensis]|uniref:Uncharacterized protein n=1 Tax=Thermovibrio guaymasensis TaxID=240167 RepID=A0A420W5E7_9BACT|nr:hypothetical protein [Thermovibrio guaymasensis]RKQ59101.1 hypothetical protein C7457_1741 [Thermovibrio guaymasensis]